MFFVQVHWWGKTLKSTGVTCICNMWALSPVRYALDSNLSGKRNNILNNKWAVLNLMERCFCFVLFCFGFCLFVCLFLFVLFVCLFVFFFIFFINVDTKSIVFYPRLAKWVNCCNTLRIIIGCAASILWNTNHNFPISRERKVYDVIMYHKSLVKSAKKNVIIMSIEMYTLCKIKPTRTLLHGVFWSQMISIGF